MIGCERLVSLREEAGRLATKTGTACLRGIRQRSKTFNQLATDPAVLALIPKGFEPVRSLLFDKTPEENWPVLWHQDLTIAVEEQIERTLVCEERRSPCATVGCCFGEDGDSKNSFG